MSNSLPALLRLAQAARSDRDLLRAHLTGVPDAFDELTRRYGELARRAAAEVCPPAADDVAQMTVALLARKAASVSSRESASGWVFETARRLALKARTADARRAAHEGHAALPQPPTDPLDLITLREIRAAVAEEVARLPDNLRIPLVLCYWDGVTRSEAAVRLACSIKTVKRRLEQGRDRLASRLARRGFCGAAILAALTTFEAGLATAGIVQPMRVIPWKLLAAAGLAATIAFVGFGIGVFGSGTADPPTRGTEPTVTAKDKGPAVDRYGDPLPNGAVARLGTVRFRHCGQVQSIAYSPDGKTIASGSFGKIMIWEAESGKPIGQIVPTSGLPATSEKSPDKQPLQGHAFGLAFTQDGQGLVVAGSPSTERAGSVLYLDVAARKFNPTSELFGADYWFRSVAVSADGKIAASATDSGTLIIFDAKTRKANSTVNLSGGSSLSFAPDGKTLAVATYKDVILIDPATGGQTKRIEVGGARQVAFAPDGRSLWIGCDGDGFPRKGDRPGTVVRWNLATEAPEQTFTSTPGMCLSLAVALDGKSVAAGGASWGPLI